MDFGNHTYVSAQKQAAIIKSLLWNSVIEVFQEEKNINISENIISVKKNISILKVRFNNPLLKQEFQYIENKISEVFHKKLSKMGIKSEKYTIKSH